MRLDSSFPLCRTLALACAVGMASLACGEAAFPDYNTAPVAPDLRGMERSAAELAAAVSLGWNMGNTLEAIGGETAWGNPRITPELIQLVKDSGFDAIRLPVAWNQYADEATAAIDPAWLERIAEVVQLCLDRDLVTIVNIHWDGGWLENNVTPAAQAAVDARKRALWEQIATRLRDFDDRLLFASANEPHVEDAAQMEVLHTYHQTFVDAVRATGGRNAFRVLVVQGPLTDIERTEALMNRMPVDTVPGRLMAEVHFYTPYDFTLMDRDQDWGDMVYYWGDGFHSADDPARNATWGEEATVDDLFTRMKTQFVDRGIPVILGEYGAMRRSDLPEAQRTPHLAARAHYHETVTRRANALGLLPFYWDNGGTGHHAFGVFDRDARTVFDPQTLDALRAGAADPTHWQQVVTAADPQSRDTDGDRVPDLLELFLGSDPADPTSMPAPPRARHDAEDHLVLAFPRAARVEADLRMHLSHDLVTWSELPFHVQTDEATLLELRCDPLLPGPQTPAFFTLEVAP